jgi:hypothetical protein
MRPKSEQTVEKLSAKTARQSHGSKSVIVKLSSDCQCPHHHVHRSTYLDDKDKRHGQIPSVSFLTASVVLNEPGEASQTE